jgi:hypothetical protein
VVVVLCDEVDVMRLFGFWIQASGLRGDSAQLLVNAFLVIRFRRADEIDQSSARTRCLLLKPKAYSRKPDHHSVPAPIRYK